MINKQVAEKARRQSNSLILVVDDEPQMCIILSRVLENEGYLVATVNNGIAAMQITQEYRPALILLDLMMPGMDGREVFRRIRQRYEEIKIIYFTAKMESDPQKLKVIAGEADGFIAKPATSKQILSKVGKVLQGVCQ